MNLDAPELNTKLSLSIKLMLVLMGLGCSGTAVWYTIQSQTTEIVNEIETKELIQNNRINDLHDQVGDLETELIDQIEDLKGIAEYMKGRSDRKFTRLEENLSKEIVKREALEKELEEFKIEVAKKN